MAEAIAKSVFKNRARIESAGSQPRSVHPLASQALSELGLSTETHHSKSISQLPQEFLDGLDYIITLCAEEVCPLVVGSKATRLHWPFRDPAAKEISQVAQLDSFRIVRDLIKQKIEVFAQSV